MAQDLSRLQSRNDNQRRLTTNRDAVLPNRQNTEAPRLEINADMRSARRGSGAEELARIFGSASDIANSFSDYTNDQHQQAEKGNAAKGQLDQLNNTVDPELMKRSEAYRTSITTGNATKGAFDTVSAARQKIEEAFGDPDNPPDLEDVEGIIHSTFAEFAVVDGKVRDFGSQQASLAVGKLLTEAQQKLVEEYRARITEQVNTKGLETAAYNYRMSFDAGAPDFEATLSQVPPGVDRKAAKGALIDAAHEYSLSVLDTDPDKAVAALDHLLTSKRADGTPSLSADERDKLRTERVAMANRAESVKNRIETERHNSNAEKLLDRFNAVPGSGTYPTVKEILDMRSRGEISAQFAGSMVSSIRADREGNGAGTEVRATRGGRGSADDDDDELSGTEAEIINMAFRRDITPDQGFIMAAELAAKGGLGSGDARYKALARVRKNLNVISTMDKARRSEIDTITTDWKEQATLRIGRLSDPVKRRRARAELDELMTFATARAAQSERRGKDGLRSLEAMLTTATRSMRRKYGL